VRVKHIAELYETLKTQPEQLHFLLVSHSLQTETKDTAAGRAMLFVTSTAFVLNGKDALWTRVTQERLCMCCKQRPAVLTYPKCGIRVCDGCKMPHAATCHSPGHCHACGGVANKTCPCKNASYCR
jgi:hypothetical protein